LNAQFHFGKLTELSFLLVLMLGWTGWLFSTMQEEVLNRGYFFANLNRLGPLRMILLSSFIFSLTHVMTKGFHPVPLLIHLVGGIGYGYVYLKSGSLWMSAVMHSLHNFFLDILFNNDYAVTLVTFSHKLPMRISFCSRSSS
jgi:membrane protease YdiL (CAAX protease family)